MTDACLLAFTNTSIASSPNNSCTAVKLWPFTTYAVALLSGARVVLNGLASALYLARIIGKSLVLRTQFANIACLKRLSMLLIFAMGTLSCCHSSIYGSVAMSFISRSISLEFFTTILANSWGIVEFVNRIGVKAYRHSRHSPVFEERKNRSLIGIKIAVCGIFERVTSIAPRQHTVWNSNTRCDEFTKPPRKKWDEKPAKH